MYATAPQTGTIRDVLWSQLGDEKLARRAASGNDGAFTALYERYHGPLLNYCRSILLNAEDAHDATQNALESALRALPDRDDGRPLRPWLYRIAHNEAVTILRRRQPHDELVDDTEPLVAPHPSPEVYAEQRGRIEQLVKDLRALPERQRGALVMRELSGLSYDEIGDALGLSPTNARRAVFDARSALLDVAGGRDADCVTIRHALSDGDRRSVRARRIRAHLRSCDGCSSFHAGIGARRADLPAIAPWLTGAAAAGALGIGAGATGGGGAVVAGGGLGWAIFPGAAKGIAVAAVIATTGTAAIEIERAVKPDRPAARSQAATGSPRSPGVYTPASAAARASRAAARRAARRAGAFSRARHGADRASITTSHRQTELKQRPASTKPKPGAATPNVAYSPPQAAPPATAVSAPKPGTAAQTLADKLREIQAQIVAALRNAQTVAATGTQSALQAASSIVSRTVSSVQALITNVLASVGITVPSSVSSAQPPPSSPSTLSSVLQPVQQVLGGVTTLLGQLFNRP